jgi:hypothetical protein
LAASGWRPEGELQQVFFPDGLTFDEGALRTEKASMFFGLELPNGLNSKEVVDLTGIALASHAAKRLGCETEHGQRPINDRTK